MSKLHEQILYALGWEHKPFPVDDTAHNPLEFHWFDTDGRWRRISPDCDSWETVMRLRELAIAKEAKLYSAALATTMFDFPGPINIGQAFRRGAEATKEQIRTAALSVLHDVPITEVQQWK